MRDRPHDIDEQAGRTEHEEPADFAAYDDASGGGPSTMDRARAPQDALEASYGQQMPRAIRLDDPCTVAIAVRIARQIVYEDRWHRRIRRRWQRVVAVLRRAR